MRLSPGRMGAPALAVVAHLLVAASAHALTLAACEEHALARSPAAHAALDAARAAAAQTRAARAGYWPTLGVKGDYGVAKGFDRAVTNGGQTDALLSLQAILFDGGGRSARLAAARASLRSATAQEAQQRADVIFAVRSAYLQAVTAEAEGAIDDEASRLLHAYAALLARAEGRGLASHAESLRAQLAVDAADASRRASAAEAATARDALGILTGLDVTQAPLDEPVLRYATPASAQLDRAPTVRDAQAALEAARAEIDVVRSARAGQLTLTADGGALGVRPGRTFRDDGGGQFLLSLGVPVFDGGVLAGRIAGAEATARSAASKVEEARQVVRLACTRSEADARQAATDEAAARRTVATAGEQLAIMRARHFGGGDVRVLDVLDAIAVYLEARRAVPRAVLAYRTAVATQGQVLGEVSE